MSILRERGQGNAVYTAPKVTEAQAQLPGQQGLGHQGNKGSHQSNTGTTGLCHISV